MWSLLKWLVWGNPEVNDDLNKSVLKLTRKNAVKKIEKAYLNYKLKKTKKQIVIDNLGLVKTRFKEQATLQSTLNSLKAKKKRRKRPKKNKNKRKREFLPIRI